MANVTLAIDDQTLKKIRAYAKARGTTLNALVRQELTRLVDIDTRQEQARKGLLDLIAQSTGRMGKDFKFNRNEMYEAAVLPRHKRPALRSRGARG